MYKYLKNNRIARTSLWTVFFLFLIVSFCCTDRSNSEVLADSGLTKKRIMKSETIKIGQLINCVQSFERKMKNSEEHSKNVITIQGAVVDIKLPEVFIKVSNVFSSNLKMEKSHWVRDKSVVKRPPYNIGTVYGFKAKHDAIDNVVYEGVNHIGFEVP